MQKGSQIMNVLQTQFEEITTLIRQTRYEALKTVNSQLIQLYWQVGCYIHERTTKDNWGKSVVTQLAQFIAAKEPQTKGFSDKNLWRMKQFYEAYQGNLTQLDWVAQVPWTHNLLIFSKSKTIAAFSFANTFKIIVCVAL